MNVDSVLVVGRDSNGVAIAVDDLKAAGARSVGGISFDWVVRGAGSSTLRAKLGSRLLRITLDRRLRPASASNLVQRRIERALKSSQASVVVCLDQASAASVHRITRHRQDVLAIFGLEVALRLTSNGALLDPHPTAQAQIPRWSTAELTRRGNPKVRLVIVGTDCDGDGTSLARAVRRRPRSDAVSLGDSGASGPLAHPVDVAGPDDSLASQTTHLLWQSTSVDQLDGFAAHSRLANGGVKQALRLVMDDVIDPAEHASMFEGSAFRDRELRDAFQESQAKRRAAREQLRGPYDVFVAESWLADGTEWTLLPTPIPLVHCGNSFGALRPPTVASWSLLSRTPMHRELQRLVDVGKIRHYNLEKVPVSMRVHVVGACDIVVDRIGLGGIGWAGRIGLAAGRIVCIPGLGVDPTVPVLRAPESDSALDGDSWFAQAIGSALSGVVSPGILAHEMAESGPEFAENHWGESAIAKRLEPWLSGEPAS